MSSGEGRGCAIRGLNQIPKSQSPKNTGRATKAARHPQSSHAATTTRTSRAKHHGLSAVAVIQLAQLKGRNARDCNDTSEEQIRREISHSRGGDNQQDVHKSECKKSSYQSRAIYEKACLSRCGFVIQFGFHTNVTMLARAVLSSNQSLFRSRAATWKLTTSVSHHFRRVSVLRARECLILLDATTGIGPAWS